MKEKLQSEEGAGSVVKGLENVVVGTSRLSYIDGQRGRLAYRGFTIEDLAAEASYEEVAYLLWNGALPDREQLAALKSALASEGVLPSEIHGLIRSAPRTKPPMEVLRTAVSALSLHDEEASDLALEANRRKAIRLTARVAGIVAATHRLQNGKEPLAPRADLSHAGSFLYCVTGALPDARRERMFDVALVLHADHGFNASTFAARVTAATLSDIYSAVTSAVGTLMGPLHGGANEKVMKMLLEVGEPSRVERYVREALSRRERIFGFGHRVYKVEDPRATVLRELSREAGELAGDLRWHEISRKLEEVLMREKGLFPNVDFYSAPFYHSLGLPSSLFVPVFAVSRIAGWTAHLLEQYADNRLIRPRSQYLGAPIGQPWVRLEER